LALFLLTLAKPALAGTIRIIGDRTPATQSNSEGPRAAEPPSSSVGGSGISGFIGDKQSTGQKPASEQAARPEPSQSTKEYTAPTTAEGKSLSEETAEQQLAKRLESLKADEKRKAAEKAAQGQPAQLKTELENKAAAAIEQEQPFTGKAEQRIVPTIADEDCLTAAAMACKEEDSPADHSANSPPVSSTDLKPIILKPDTSETTERLPDKNLAKEPVPKSSSNSDFPLEYWLMQMRTKFQEQWRQP
jgi:hypothetical protein